MPLGRWLTLALLVWTLLPPTLAVAQSCTHYASPTGTGDGLSPGSPFQISSFWAVASPGSTLCLLDGTYRGAASMITPPSGLNGSAGQPITIRALNDGKVTLDGESARRVVFLSNNSWWVLEGFNAHHPNVSSVIRLTNGANNNTIRRVCAWDAEDGNDAVVSAGSNSNTLLEDVAAWGIGRKVFSGSQGGNYLTCRRCFGRWEGSTYLGPKMTYTTAYNNDHMLVENSIGAWSGERQPETYTLKCEPGNTNPNCGTTWTNFEVDQPQAIFATDRMDNPPADAETKVLASIAYLTPSDTFAAPMVFYWTATANGFTYRDNAVYIPPGLFGSKRPTVFTGQGNLLSASRHTVVGGGAPVEISSIWNPTAIYQGTSPPSGSIFTNNTFARICTRTVNGTLTSTPLWPWPMNQRIKDAMVESGRSAIDITALVAQMFGQIPGACLEGGGSPTPTSLRFVQHPTSTTAATVLTPPVTVEVLDQFGNRVADSTAPITVALIDNTEGATLGGTTTVAAVQGLATWSTLEVDTIGAYRLRASATLNEQPVTADSTAFNIVLPPAPAGTRLLWRMLEGTGGTLTDDGDDGTWAGTLGTVPADPAWTTRAPAIPALAFTAAEHDRVEVPTFAWAPNQAVTVVAWVKTGGGGTGGGWFQVGADAATDLFGAHLLLNENRLYWNYGASGNLFWQWPPSLEGVWTHIALTATGPSGMEKAIYVNGQKVASWTGTGANSAPSTPVTGLILGKHHPISTDWWCECSVSGFRIDNRAWTPEEVETDYQGAPPGGVLIGHPSSFFLGRP